METGVIYGFFDRDGVCRYVGQTAEQPWSKRVRGHLRASFEPTTRWEQWLGERVEAGEIPRVELLERCELAAMNERERHWISTHKETVLNTTHVLPPQTAAANVVRRVVVSTSPCDEPDERRTDEEWAAVTKTEARPHWEATRLPAVRRAGPEAFGPREVRIVHSERRGVELTHAKIAGALLRGDEAAANMILRLAILSDWRDRHEDGCRRLGEPHMSRGTLRGLAKAMRTAETWLDPGDVPEWHHSSRERTRALDVFEVWSIVTDHIDLCPESVSGALRAACSGYAAFMASDVMIGEPEMLRGCGTRIPFGNTPMHQWERGEANKVLAMLGGARHG